MPAQPSRKRQTTISSRAFPCQRWSLIDLATVAPSMSSFRASVQRPACRYKDAITKVTLPLPLFLHLSLRPPGPNPWIETQSCLCVLMPSAVPGRDKDDGSGVWDSPPDRVRSSIVVGVFESPLLTGVEGRA